MTPFLSLVGKLGICTIFKAKKMTTAVHTVTFHSQSLEETFLMFLHYSRS